MRRANDSLFSDKTPTAKFSFCAAPLGTRGDILMTIETTNQVDLLYALFLGRMPENNFVRQDNIGRPIFELIRAMIISGEFREAVLERFLLRGSLPHRTLSLQLLPDVLALIADTRLAEASSGTAAADWQLVLGRALAGGPCRQMLQDTYGAEALELIERLQASFFTGPANPRLAAQPPAEPATDIIAGAEVVANALCRGWVVDRAHPATSLHVGVKLNGSTVKVIIAQDFRRDVQERYGGDGRVGFTVQFDLLPNARNLNRATIEMIELSRGVIVLAEQVVEFSTAPAATLEAQLREEITLGRETLARLQSRFEEGKEQSWRMAVPKILRSSSPRIEEDTAKLTTQLATLQQTLDRLEQRLPQFWNARRWTLQSYGVVRRSENLVPPAPAVSNPATFSLIVRDDPGASAEAMAATVASILDQSLAPKEVAIVAAESAQLDFVQANAKIEVLRFAPAQSSLTGMNSAAARTSGSHLLFLNAGSTLATEALAWLAAAIDRTGGSIIYTDSEVKTKDEEGREAFAPVFRSAFDYEMLLQCNYIGGIFCVERQAYLTLGGFTADPNLDPDHDFLLRAVIHGEPSAFIHLPLVLAASPMSLSAGDEPWARGRGLCSVQRHLDRSSPGAQAIAHTDPIGRDVQNAVKIIWPQNPEHRISVIIPTRDRADLVFALISSLHRLARGWDRIEVLIVVNGDPGPPSRSAFSEIEEVFRGVRIAYREVPFNWGEINNTAIEDSGGDIILFLNDDMICLTDRWDDRLREQLGRSDVGVVGGRLLYPNGAIQHAGITFCGEGMTAHEAMGDLPSDGLYLDRTLLVHEIGAVTGALLACRRATFHKLGGFDAQRYAVTSSDADFCVRARLDGRRVIYDPFLTWIHYESISRGQDSHDYKKQWRAEIEQELWQSNFSEMELMDLSLNPHLAHSPRPFETFRRANQAEIDMWLQAQLRGAVG
jgi:O-antigen biosynthesis protein